MSLKDFQTILLPSTKNGALQFYHKPTKAILEAAFSRPDVGATSGATIFDKDGNLEELAEDAPDWSFPLGGGCPRLLMRPQALNECLHSDDLTGHLWTSRGVLSVTPSAINLGDASLSFVQNLQSKSTGDIFYQRPGFSSGDPYSFAFLIDKNGQSATIRIENPGSPSYGTADLDLSLVENGTQKIDENHPALTISVPFTVNNSGGIGVFFSVASGIIDVYIGGVTMSTTRSPGIIPTNGSALTRSANLIEWNNMQLAGVLSSDAGSWLIKLKDYKSWANVSTFLRLDGNGSDTLRLSARTADQLLLLYDAGLGTNSLGAAFNGQDAIVSITYDTTWLRVFVGASKHAEIEHGGSLSLDNLRTNITSAFAEIALMAFTPVFLSDSKMITANTEVQNL